MVGQTIGKYRIVDRLGRGGMGTVYRAVDETLHREVAIKVLNAELNDPGIGRRFRAEAVAIARLNHPGIALIYELVQHDGQWLMVIEYVRGETLESLVARSGPVPAPQAAELTIQVLSALAHAHSMGVVHRDLKPPNIMITETDATKIMDFGIARVAGTEHLTSAGLLMGTPAYMAPEQVMGGEIDTRTDLYSVGVVLYHLLTGKLPFKGETPMAMVQSRIRDLPTPIRAIRQDLPAWISIVMERALERAADRRFQSADEMRDALRRGLSGLPVEVPGPLPTPPELIATVPPGSSTWATHPSVPPNPTRVGSDTPTVIVSPTRSDRLAPAGSAVEPGTGQPAAASQGPSQPTVAAPAFPAPAPANASSKTLRMPTLAAIAAGVVALLIGGALVVRFMRDAPPPAPSVTPPPSTTAAPAPVEPPPPDDPAGPATPGATVTPPPASGAPSSNPGTASVAPPPSPPQGTGGARGTPDRTGTPAGPSPSAETGRGPGSPTPPTSVSPATSPGLTPTGPARGSRGVPTPPATPTDTVVRFDAIKHLEVVARIGTERDAVVYLGGGLISLVTRTGAPIFTLQYRDLVSATHIRAKDPKWDDSLPGPPANVDVPGGMFRSMKHWLTLQSRTHYFVLRLEGNNWKNIVDTLEARTGIRVALASR